MSEFEEFKDGILRALADLKEGQNSMWKEIRKMNDEITGVKIEMERRRGLFQGGKVMAGIIGGLIGFLVSLLSPLSILFKEIKK